MFLNFNLLELHELGPPGLKVQTASRFVDAAVVAGALEERHEIGAVDLVTKIPPPHFYYQNLLFAILMIKEKSEFYLSIRFRVKFYFQMQKH